jgi:hypothetical protein
VNDDALLLTTLYFCAVSEPECATPNYNFTILADMFICDNQISNKISETGSYRDTVKLLKVWLEQRSLRKV